MSHSNGIITAPVDIKGDISTVLGTSSGDLGANCTSNAIQPMAKYKPIRSSKIGELTDQDFINAKYGFSSTVYPPVIYANSFMTSKGPYTYQKPRGQSNNEWFRALDFNGYAHYAISPFIMRLGNELYSGGYLPKSTYQINLKFGVNQDAEQIYEDEGIYNRVWATSGSKVLNLSIADLLQTAYDSNYYLTLFIVDESNTSSQNIVIFNKPINSLTDYWVGSIYPGGGEYAAHEPEIPILKNATIGHYFTICACVGSLPSGVYFSAGNKYKVLTSDASAKYSLAFEPGCERLRFRIDQIASDISGAITKITINPTNVISYHSDSGSYYRKFIISEIDATITTGNWDVPTANVNFNISMIGERASGYGNIWFGSDIYDARDNNRNQYTLSRTITNVSRNTQNLVVNLVSSSNPLNVYVWLMDAPEYDAIVVSGTANRPTYSPAQLTSLTSRTFDYDE